jgi:hypothetical protein
MSQNIAVENIEIFRQTLGENKVAVIVDTGKKIFCYGDLILEHLKDDIESRIAGARVLNASAKIIVISKA